MKKTTKHESEKANILKAARTAIRLKHSLNADAEMRVALPRIEKEMDLALNKGKAYKLNLAELVDG